MRPFARFYDGLDKRQRMEFRKEAMSLLNVASSTFYYRVHHGNMFPVELLTIKPLLEKYGCKKEDMLLMGFVD